MSEKAIIIKTFGHLCRIPCDIHPRLRSLSNAVGLDTAKIPETNLTFSSIKWQRNIRIFFNLQNVFINPWLTFPEKSKEI